MSEPYPIESVEWRDHWRTTEQAKAREFGDRAPMRSVGYIVRETQQVLSLAQTLVKDEDEQEFQHTTHIEKALIVSRTRLRRNGNR